MQKILCLISLAISGIVCLLFVVDLVLGMAGMVSAAPFKFANMWMDIVFALGAGTIAVMSWFTYREQRR
jgi:hypothetical protein